jgi:hypothetical protein
VPVEFLTDEQVAVYGQYTGPPSRAQLERCFVLDHDDLMLALRRRRRLLVNGRGGGLSRSQTPTRGNYLSADMLNWQAQAPFQQIVEVYWSVTRSALRDLVDQVRTTLTALVAELLAALPDDRRSRRWRWPIRRKIRILDALLGRVIPGGYRRADRLGAGHPPSVARRSGTELDAPAAKRNWRRNPSWRT